MKTKGEKAYIKDMATEMLRLENADLSTEGNTLSPVAQETSRITLPSGIEADLIHSTLTVSSMGGAGSVVTHTVDNDTGDVNIAILTDWFFDQLSPAGKRYIIAHENGHIVKGHIGTADEAKASMALPEPKSSNVTLNRKLENELAADRFAVMINGKQDTLKGMTNFRKVMKQNAWAGFDDTEIRTRIKRIKALHQVYKRA